MRKPYLYEVDLKKEYKSDEALIQAYESGTGPRRGTNRVSLLARRKSLSIMEERWFLIGTGTQTWVKKTSRAVLSIFVRDGDIRVLLRRESDDSLVDVTYLERGVSAVLLSAFAGPEYEKSIRLFGKEVEKFLQRVGKNPTQWEDIHSREGITLCQLIPAYLSWYSNPQFLGDLLGTSSFEEYLDSYLRRRDQKWGRFYDRKIAPDLTRKYWANLLARRASKIGMRNALGQLLGLNSPTVVKAAIYSLRTAPSWGNCHSGCTFARAVALKGLLKRETLIELLRTPCANNWRESSQSIRGESLVTLSNAQEERKALRGVMDLSSHGMSWIEDTALDLRGLMLLKDLLEGVSRLKLRDVTCTLPRKLEEAHDYVAIRLLQTEDEVHYPDWPRPSNFRIHGKDDGIFTYRLPMSSLELKLWGKQLHHCIGNYAHIYAERRTLLIGVFEGDELIATADISPSGEIRQLYGKYNRELPPATDEVICHTLQRKELYEEFFKCDK